MDLGWNIKADFLIFARSKVLTAFLLMVDEICLTKTGCDIAATVILNLIYFIFSL